jgi:formate-dependent nitrite reductase membrane component NrfD
VGLEPACVVVCPTQAIIVGDLTDPDSDVTRIVQRDAVAVRRPEKGTRPTLFYKGAHQATLDPLAARRPPGGIFAWSEQGPQVAGRGGPGTSSAAALLSYDIPHRAPWDWRVSLYTWTKGIAAGSYLAPLVLVLADLLGRGNDLWLWAAPLVALGFLALTGAILIWDLEHPRRFHYLFLRPQWRSWLVRGAVALTAYGGVLALHLLLSIAGADAPQEWLAIAGIPAAVAAAVYTGFLFAQAKARDFWQSPLLVPHLLVQAGLLGAATMLPFAHWLAEEAIGPLEWLLAGAAVAHLVMAAAEATLTHPTAHARLAAHELTRGRYARFFWAGAVLVLVAVFAPLIGVAAVPLALAGVLAYEHAHVQAGQSVPLA